MDSADRDDHAAPRFQLRDERRWNVVRSCGYDDGIERRMLCPALVAIADFRRNIAVAQTFEVGTGHFAELWYDLDGVHLAGEHGEDRGLVSRSRAYLQDLIRLRQLQQLRHQRDDDRF